MDLDLVPIPEQPIGPFFHVLTDPQNLGCMAGPDAQGERVRLMCRVFDSEGAPVANAMLELWQADAAGKYNHPEDTQEKTADPSFRGFGRRTTGADGDCVFETVKPGRVPGWNGSLQAPHIDVSVYTPGLLRRAVTRIYFAGDPANPDDRVLTLVPEDRRETLMAHADPEHPGAWNFTIRLRGESETVFFDI